MKFLIVSNILQWAVLLFIFSNKSLPWATLEWRKTFFGDVRYGFEIIFWKKTGVSSSVGKKIFGFNWVNPKKIQDKPNCKPNSIWAKPWSRQ